MKNEMLGVRFFKENLISISVLSIILGLSGCVTIKNGIAMSEDHSRALSGERTKMGQSYNLNANCTVATIAKIKLVQAPAHGSVDFVKENIFPNMRLSACIDKNVIAVAKNTHFPNDKTSFVASLSQEKLFL